MGLHFKISQRDTPHPPCDEWYLKQSSVYFFCLLGDLLLVKCIECQHEGARVVNVQFPLWDTHFVYSIFRFCLLETSCEQDDLFPHSAGLKVNGKLCQLPVSFGKQYNGPIT